MAKKDNNYWQEQIRFALKFREQYGRSKDWPTIKKYHRNQFGADVLSFNLQHVVLRSTIPKIYHKNPYIMVRPHNKDFSIPCRMREAALNYVIEENGTKQTMREIAEYAWLFGQGPGLVGFDAPPPMTLDDILFDSVRQKERKDKHEFNLFKKENLPWFVAIHPENFLVPFGTKFVTNMPWGAHAVLRDLDDLKKDNRYDASDLKSTHLPEDYMRRELRDIVGEEPTQQKFVYFWEIHDFRTGEIKALIENKNKWLRKPEVDPSQISGLPFVSCQFNPDPDYLWCTSDAMYIEPQLLEGNEVRTQARAHRQIGLMKLIIDEGLFDKDQLEKLTHGEVATVIESKLPNIKDRMHIFQPHIPPDLFPWNELTREDARELTGLGRNQTGATEMKTHISATQTMAVQRGSDTRIGEKQDAMRETLLSAVRKMDELMSKNWQDEMTIKVMGVDAQVYWVKYSAKDLEGEYTIKIDPESMVEQPPGQKKAELVDLIARLQNNPSININYLTRVLLREYQWIDVMEALPESPLAPMNAEEFLQQQQRMLQQMEGQEGRRPAPQQGAA